MSTEASSMTELIAINPEPNLSDLRITSGGKETTTDDHRETPAGRMLYSSRIEVYSGQIFEQNGAYLRTCSTFAGNGAALWNSKGSAYITGGGFASNAVTMVNMGGAIYNSEGYLELKNVSFYSNTASDGGAICNDSGTVFISGCSFWENESLQAGGAILTRGGSMYIVNTLFERHFPFALNSNNPVYSNAAVLTMENGAFVSISGGAFINNVREANGGGGGAINGVCDTRLELETVVFYHNSAINGNGGGVYGNGGDFFMDQCAFSSNTATYTGGGFSYSYLMVPGAVSSVNLNDTNFYKNSAVYGGGAYFGGIAPIISGGLFSSNTAPQGGGLFLDYTAQVIISGTSFYSNSASSGGAVYCHGNGASWNRPIEFKDVVFSGNHATSMYCGGALYNDRAHVKINGCSFSTPYDTIINTGTITFCGQNYFDNYILCNNVIEMPNVRIDLRDSPDAKTHPVINWISQILGPHNEWQIIVDELIEDGTYLLAGKGNLFNESMALCNELSEELIPCIDLNTGLDVHLYVGGATVTTTNYNCALTLTYEGPETYLSLVIDRIRYDHLYLNSAWSNCNYGDIVCPVSGGTAVYGKQAFSNLADTWDHLYENGTMELENESFVFYEGLFAPAEITFASNVPAGNRIVRFDTSNTSSSIPIQGLSTSASVVCQGLNALNDDEVIVDISDSSVGGNLICGAEINTSIIQSSSDEREITNYVRGVTANEIVFGNTVSANALMYYSTYYESSFSVLNSNVNSITAGDIIKVNSGTASTTCYGSFSTSAIDVSVNGLFCAGSKIYANCAENRQGDIHLYIDRGYYQTICGGDAVLASDASGSIAGDISMEILGGTFGTIFGNNYASDGLCSFVANGIHNGDTDITFESVDDIYLNGMIYGGGSYYHHTTGASIITFMGYGSNYHFASTAGISGDSQYGNPTGVWSNNSNTGRYVQGTRTLGFKNYTGDFDCQSISCFDSFSLVDSNVEFTNAIDLSNINEWSFSNTTANEDSSLVWLSGLCGFNGDRFIVESDLENWTLLTTTSSMLSSSSFASLSNVTLNDTAAIWNSVNIAWETTTDSLSWHNNNGIVSIQYTSIV